MNLKGESGRIGGGQQFSSGASVLGPRKDGIAQANALLFHPIEEAAGPDKFGCQDTQSQHYGEPTGAGRNDHEDPERKQGESEEDLQEALRLL